MYEIGPMFWYKLVFMTELIAADATIVYRLRRRKYFPLRLVLSLIGCYGLALAVPFGEGAWWSIVMFLALFAISTGAVAVCFKERPIKILFCAVSAYTLQHIAFEIFDFLAIAMGFSNAENVIGSGSIGFMMIYGASSNTINVNPFTLLVYLFVYGITYFFGFLFIRSRIKAGDFGADNIKTFVIAGVILFFDVIVSSVIAAYRAVDFSKTYMLFLDAFNIFCCLFALYLLFDVDDRHKLRTDLYTVKRLWKEKEEQYNLSKSNIELINQKCHDLKHQIRTIGKRGELDKEVVKEIEDVISIYDSPVRTDNEALDVILTEKSLLCNSMGVKLCCIIDGKKLGFMTDADLYALFGNIIDNAIEAVENLDEGKRTISLSVKETNGFLVVNIHNYYNGVLRFEHDKLPQTTKRDKAYHGYGMKSVKMLCDKYGGEMSIHTENSVFNLNILFPMHKEKR